MHTTQSNLASWAGEDSILPVFAFGDVLAARFQYARMKNSGCNEKKLAIFLQIRFNIPYICSVLISYYTMIDIKDLCFGYSTSRRLFSGLTLPLHEGVICGLLGRNGVGKSTLLNLVAGLLHPVSGSVSCNGVSTFERRVETLSEMFYVPERFNLPSVRLRDWLRLVSPFYPRYSASAMSSCLELFEVDGDFNLAKMSMGQRKKAMLSFALSSGVSVLLLDEPTNGLDIPSKGQFRSALSRFIDDGRTVLVSTHQVADVENLLDHVVVLGDGNVLLNCSLADLSRKLSFVTSSQAPSDAYYSQPSVGGVAAVVPFDGEHETVVNLELLFNALMSSPALRGIFGKEVCHA